MAKWDKSAESQQEWVIYVDAGGIVNFRINSSPSAASPDTILSASSAIDVNTWHHIKTGWDGLHQLAAIFIDDMNVPAAFTASAVPTMNDSIANITIGYGAVNSPQEVAFDGLIDEVAIIKDDCVPEPATVMLLGLGGTLIVSKKVKLKRK